jgi:predicted phosphoribosyltransferase
VADGPDDRAGIQVDYRAWRYQRRCRQVEGHTLNAIVHGNVAALRTVITSYNVERLRLQPLAARERKQLGREFSPALGRKPHVRKPLLQFWIADTGIRSFQKSNVSKHDSEQVIEVVRDAGRKLTNRFQSLHLAQRRLA